LRRLTLAASLEARCFRLLLYLKKKLKNSTTILIFAQNQTTMSKTEQIDVSKLNLDLNNFRTTPQKTEEDAIKAMIAIKSERFYAIMESIIDDGYLHTENIIVLDDSKQLIVKEGNRRIAAMKLIHKLHKIDEYLISDALQQKINNLDKNWYNENSKVPCSIFDLSDSTKVDKIIALTHGKGEKASRFSWTSVATARHNRDINNASEPALDLLEKYIENGQNISNQQKDRWAGDYPLTVLAEAINKIANRFELKTSAELAKNYPKIKYRFELEDLMRDIGLERIGFSKIRSKEDFAEPYGIIAPVPPNTPQNNTNQGASQTSGSTSQNSGQAPSSPTQPNTPPGSTATGDSQTTSTPGNNSSAPKAPATNDPKFVASLLKKFTPRGTNRQKVVTLRDELKLLDIKKNPIAFCFLLRSIFEISAKAYATDNSININNTNGREKSLLDLLKEITNKLTQNNSNTSKAKVLHGAIAELGRTEGFLSVTSLNQLVHNPNFSVTSNDICTLFGNIYPLLEEMN
jgi:hypothetical protein